jgi:hypothetical protein
MWLADLLHFLGHGKPSPEPLSYYESENGDDEDVCPDNEDVADVGNAHLRPFDPADTLIVARRAQDLLSDPVLRHAFEVVAQSYRHSWENAPRGDLDRQILAHRSLAALKDVEGALKTFVQNGKLFEQKEDDRRQAELKKEAQPESVDPYLEYALRVKTALRTP